jgi:K+/H+ antiporter YhaU regulatory subunit KhtT
MGKGLVYNINTKELEYINVIIGKNGKFTKVVYETSPEEISNMLKKY